jgi:hypothetical protein
MSGSINAPPIRPSTPTATAGVPGDLSAMGILLYFQTANDSIDQETQGYMTQQQKVIDAKNACNKLLSTLDQYANAGVTNDATACNDIKSALDAAIAACPDASASASLVQARTILNTGTDTSISTKEISDATDAIKQGQATLDSGSELNMMKLQGYMSQQTTLTQLATNLVNAVDESPKAIASNIGH